MKFYATRPSRGRLTDDVLAFVSLLKFERDEQALRLVRAPEGLALAQALHAALAAAKLPGADGFESNWRSHLEDPLDPYGPEVARAIEADASGEIVYRLVWDREPSEVVGRFRVEPQGAGFTLGFLGFDRSPRARLETVPTEKPKAKPRSRARAPKS